MRRQTSESLDVITRQGRRRTWGGYAYAARLWDTLDKLLEGDRVQDQPRVSLDAEVRIDRGDLGLTWKGLGASMLNTLIVHAVFTRC